MTALGAKVVIERLATLRPGPTWRGTAPVGVSLALVALFLVELGVKPLPLQAVAVGREVPEAYRWLARERPGPIVEIPLDPLGSDQSYLYPASCTGCRW